MHVLHYRASCPLKDIFAVVQELRRSCASNLLHTPPQSIVTEPHDLATVLQNTRELVLGVPLIGEGASRISLLDCIPIQVVLKRCPGQAQQLVASVVGPGRATQSRQPVSDAVIT